MYKFLLAAAFVACASAAAVVTDDLHAKVLAQKSDVRADGFDSVLDTSNHIHQVASGDVYGNIHGDIEWISPEGVKVDIKYVADENGYQPSGDVIPTPHPIPEAILKAMAYIKAHPPKEEHHK